MALTRHLLPYWLRDLLEDSDGECIDSGTPKKLLRGIHRIAMWNMAYRLHIERNGVPAQACRLLERYIAIKMKEFANTENDTEDWDELRLTLEDNMPLLMASCIQLAAKMASNKASLTAKIVRTRLATIGISTDIQELIQMEFQVFSTIGCKVPLWTSLDLAQLLAHRAGLPAAVMTMTELMVEMAELKKNELQWRLRLTANVPLSGSACRLRSLHLCAGAVLAATHLHDPSAGSQPLELLASVTQTTSLYLHCIASHILVFFELDETA